MESEGILSYLDSSHILSVVMLSLDLSFQSLRMVMQFFDYSIIVSIIPHKPIPLMFTM